jgi:2-isopropylmalate synthase
VANSLAGVDAGAVQVQGHDQRRGRALRQRRLISVMANLALKKQGLSGARRAARAPDRAVAVRLRDGEHELPPISRSSGKARSPTRAGCTSTPSPGPRQLRAHRPGSWSATSGGFWSASCRAARTSWPHGQAQAARRPGADGQDSGPGGEAGERGYQFEAAEASFDLLVRSAPARFSRTSSGSSTTSRSARSVAGTW